MNLKNHNRRGRRRRLTKRPINSLTFIKKLLRSSVKDRRKILRNIEPKYLRLLSEACLNFLQNKIPVSPRVRAKILKHKGSLLKIVDRRVPCETRKRIFIRQSGGFLAPLLTAVLPIISSIVASQLNK
jgi:hypothetical protein